jgi:hypothetical protein
MFPPEVLIMENELLSFSITKLQALYRLYLPVISAMEIPFCGPIMRVAHQSLKGPKIIPVVQKSCGAGVTINLRRSVLNQGKGVNGN